jgi:hypothetical protein
MEFKTGNDLDTTGTGSSLQGYVTTTRSALIETFGMPTFTTDEDYEKVTTEWIIKFQDGTIATIYDWKRYEEGAPALNEVYEWHIGGYSETAVSRVQETLASAPVSLA